MNPQQQALYNAAIALAYFLAKGGHVDRFTPFSVALLNAAHAAAAADGGKTLRQAAEAL